MLLKPFSHERPNYKNRSATDSWLKISYCHMEFVSLKKIISDLTSQVDRKWEQ